MDKNTDLEPWESEDARLLLQEYLGLDNLEAVDALIQQQADLISPPKVKSGVRKAKKAIFKSMCKEAGLDFKPSLRECWSELERTWKAMADCGIEDQRVPSVMKLSKIAEQHLRKIAMAQYERNKGVPWACLH